MLIIGHRGAKGLKPENTLEGIRAGQDADVDMIEVDVRLTKDKVPILIHDAHLWHTHKLPYAVNRMTYQELQQRTTTSVNPIATLDAVLKEFGGELLLNLELKEKGSAAKILPLLKTHIIKLSDWENYVFSSFHVSELEQVHTLAPRAQLAVLNWHNPLKFILVNNRIPIIAVGFHRLHVNAITLGAAKKLGLFTYAYTVNRPGSAVRLANMGVDGIVTDYPNVIAKCLIKHRLR